MHDGQNVFCCKESHSGYSWKVIPKTKNYKELLSIIIVGIDNIVVDRLDEYPPWHTDVGECMGFKYGEYGQTTYRAVLPH